MAYTTPSTWVAGAVLTAAQLNEQLRDNQLAAFPLGVGAWTGYTPTLTQSVTVTKTVTHANYHKIGRVATGAFLLTVTGAGTAANGIVGGLPVAAAGPANLCVGQGYVYDSSANLFYAGMLRLVSSTTVNWQPASTDSTSGGILGVSVMTAGLAAGDLVVASFTYQSQT